MNQQQSIISGWSVNSAFAADFDTLIQRISAGDKAESEAFFSRDSDAKNAKLPLNPHHLPLVVERTSKKKNSPQQRIFVRCVAAIDHALKRAGLTAAALQQQAVRLYLPCVGPRADVNDFAGYQDRNDAEDLLFFPKIKHLHAAHFAQDALCHQLAVHYQLSWPPQPLYSASSSAIASLYQAHHLLQQGSLSLAVIVSWTEFTLQDALFMGGQGMLGSGNAQPFSPATDNSVLPASGTMAMVLEQQDHALQRGFQPQVGISSVASHQSSGARGGNTFSADFRAIAKTIEKSLALAQINADDVACCLPHGNGIYSSDKAEAMALCKIWGERGIPVVSYKGQVGYFSSCSGLLDVMLATDALQQGRLLAFSTRQSLDSSLQLALHADSEPLRLQQQHVVKSAMGLEGSVFSVVISRYTEGAT